MRDVYKRQHQPFAYRKHGKQTAPSPKTLFEIDMPKDDKQKGPSKENRHDPIIGQALLLDADLVPLAMQMYPGNESEKQYIRKAKMCIRDS